MTAPLEVFGIPLKEAQIGVAEQDSWDAPVRVRRHGVLLDAIWFSGSTKKIKVEVVRLNGGTVCLMSQTSHSLFALDGRHLHGGQPRLLSVFGRGEANTVRHMVLQALAAAKDGLARRELKTALGLSDTLIANTLADLKKRREIEPIGYRHLPGSVTPRRVYGLRPTAPAPRVAGAEGRRGGVGAL